MEHRLTTPCTREALAALRAGDTVLLSGVVYTARDAAHKRMMECLDKVEALPFPLEGSAVYYVGPTPEQPGRVIGAAGPTTSGRMDPYSPRLIALGQRVMIGKGARDKAVKEALKKEGAVYLAALGGAEVQLKSHVQGALKAGNTREEVVCALVHASGYMGIPRLFNALNACKEPLQAGERGAPASAACAG